MLLGKARTHYLEFLRNLTPQVLLFSVVLILGGKLNFTKFDISNWYGTLLFCLFLLYFCLAFYANSSLFYEKCFERNYVWTRRVSLVLNKKEYPPLKRAAVRIREVWRRRKVEFIEMIIVFHLLQAALAAVVFIGTHSAIQFLNK